MTANDRNLKEWFIDVFIALISGNIPWKNTPGVIDLISGAGSVLAVMMAIGLWATSLSRLNPVEMTDYGLPSIMPLAMILAFIILIVSFSLLLRRSQVPEALLLLHGVALIVIIHGTVPLVYGTLRYSWAWKHIGIIDYIQRFGRVNPEIPIMDAYHNWPGFFALGAFLTEATGLTTSLSFAGWAPVFFNLIDLGAVVMICSALTQDRRLVWATTWFFFLTSWVGQDYFAPQALGYFFHLIIVGICLKWFSRAVPPSPKSLRRWLKIGWVTSLVHSLLQRVSPSDVQFQKTNLSQRVWLIFIIVLLFVVIAFSHQLTPFMTVASVLALVIFLRINIYNLPVLMAVIMVTWIIFGATVFMQGEIVDLVTSIGQVTDTVDSNLIDLSQASAGQRLVALVGRGLTALVLGLAFLGGLRRMRWGRWDLSAVLLIATPFAILAVNSYGGEIIFRVYMFALPFLAFFTAALLFPNLQAGRSWWSTLAMVVFSGILLTGFLFAHFGKDRQYYFTPAEVEAGRYLAEIAPPNTLLIEGSRNYPSRFQNYEYFYYVAISREPLESRLGVVNNPVEVLARWLDNDNYAAAYLIITRGQKAETDALGEMPPGSLDKIEQALQQSSKFQIIYENKDATIFSLRQPLNEVKP